MKKIAVFCIPAHGHTNPMLPVVRELAARGDEVRFYSFSEFQEKIEQTGAAFVGCDRFLPELTVQVGGIAVEGPCRPGAAAPDDALVLKGKAAQRRPHHRQHILSHGSHLGL